MKQVVNVLNVAQDVFKINKKKRTIAHAKIKEHISSGILVKCNSNQE